MKSRLFIALCLFSAMSLIQACGESAEKKEPVVAETPAAPAKAAQLDKNDNSIAVPEAAAVTPAEGSIGEEGIRKLLETLEETKEGSASDYPKILQKVTGELSHEDLDVFNRMVRKKAYESKIEKALSEKKDTTGMYQRYASFEKKSKFLSDESLKLFQKSFFRLGDAERRQVIQLYNQQPK